jgi:hypothetical protein
VAAPAILKIDIIADATKAAGALKKTGGAAEQTGGKFSKMGKVVAGAFAGGAALSFAKSAISAAEGARQSTAKLNAVFKATGDTTGTAAKAAQDYAGSLSKKIGVDDDAIMSGQAMLATFAAVSSETARSAGIFDRATAAGADLAAAGFGTIESNAVQMGKALQDPTKGITALGRAGVTFTDAQKKQIAAMQKSGDLLGAQKVVLGAVEGQVKGTAAATVTESAKMTTAFGETTESIGGALLPVLDALSPVLQGLATFIQENITWLAPLIGAVLAVAAAVWLWNFAMAANPLVLVAIGIALVIAGIILLVKNWSKVTAAFLWLFGWLRSNWPLLLAILTGPIGLAVLWIVRNWDKVKGAVGGVFDWIKNTWSGLLGILTGPFDAAWSWISGIIEQIRGAISGALSWAGETAGRIASALKGPVNAVIRFWNGIEFRVPEINIGPLHLGGQTIGLPDIPTLATGGLVRRTGLALVHEGEQFSGVGRSFGGGVTEIHVHVETTGLGADAPQIQRAVVAALRGFVTRNGPLDIPVRKSA